MSILEAIILGIIQGLTEFIPISSTAHLTIAGNMMGLVDPAHPEQWTAFIAVIQLGTLAAVLLYFAKEIRAIPVAFFKENVGSGRKSFSSQSLYSRLGWFIILGSIPVVIVGLGFKDFIEGEFTKDLKVIGFSLIILALILAVAEKTAGFKKGLEKITWLDSLIVGLGQWPCFNTRRLAFRYDYYSRPVFGDEKGNGSKVFVLAKYTGCTRQRAARILPKPGLYLLRPVNCPCACNNSFCHKRLCLHSFPYKIFKNQKYNDIYTVSYCNRSNHIGFDC